MLRLVLAVIVDSFLDVFICGALYQFWNVVSPSVFCVVIEPYNDSEYLVIEMDVHCLDNVIRKCSPLTILFSV